MGRKNPDDRCRTMRVPAALHGEMWDYCEAYRRRTGQRLPLLHLLEATWDSYKKNIGADPSGTPPVALRDGQERRFVTTALDALRSLPESQREATILLLLRLLAATPEAVAANITKPKPTRK